MHLFYILEKPCDTYVFDENESRHCIRVLRLKTKDILYLTDGRGNLYKAEIIDDNPKRCVVHILDHQSNTGNKKPSLHIGIAPTKNIARFEWFLEKATEVGISEITPLICDQSERRIIKTERLHKVLVSAMKQSLQTHLPILNPLENLKDFVVKGYKAKKFIGYCDEKAEYLKKACKQGEDAIILIGPEGDFSGTEFKRAKENGFVPISLGKNRLRTETAGLVACTIFNMINDG